MRNILVRLNLLLGIIEAIRTKEDEEFIATKMAGKLQKCLEIFCDFGVIPPGLIAKAIVLSLKAEKEITDSLEAWELLSELAYEVWDQADAKAEIVRKSERFGDVMSIAQASLPYYEASVALLIEAMIRYKTLTNSDSNDLLRDFGVVEEYRVGVIELLGYFGHHLISRPCHFLFRLDTGLTVSESVRKVLLAARSEISKPYRNLVRVDKMRSVVTIPE